LDLFAQAKFPKVSILESHFSGRRHYSKVLHELVDPLWREAFSEILAYLPIRTRVSHFDRA
jgi:hypothetical protein